MLREKHRLRVFENRVLRKLFGPKREEVIGEWIKLHNEELYDHRCSPYTIRVIRSRRMRPARHAACVWKSTGDVGIWWGDLREKTT
jgi:hypothetical protein